MNRERIENYANLTVTALGAVALFYVLIRYAFTLALPFLIAWGIAYSVRPLAKKISDGTKIPIKLVSVSLTILFTLGVLSVFVSALIYALGEAWKFLSELLESESFYTFFERIMNPIKGVFGEIEGSAAIEERLNEALKGSISSLLAQVVNLLKEIAFSVPKFLLFLLVSVVSSIYFSLDLDRINAFVITLLPKRAADGVSKFKNRFLVSVVKYLRSYLIIMVITFMVMLLGFLLLGVKYAVFFAFAVALLDVLPLIGVGTVLIPWSIYQLIFGSLSKGMGIAILYVSYLILRQIAEPKIIGKSLGIHPVISIMLLYAGYNLFGFVGIFLIPVVSVVIKTLTEEKTLKAEK